MPSFEPAWSIAGLVGVFAYFVLPALIVLGTKRPAAGIGLWALATLFTGWLGLAIFLAATESRCWLAGSGHRPD
jgi:hypothetical protein